MVREGHWYQHYEIQDRKGVKSGIMLIIIVSGEMGYGAGWVV